MGLVPVCVLGLGLGLVPVCGLGLGLGLVSVCALGLGLGLVPVCGLQVEVNRSSRVQCLTEQASSSVYMDSRSVTLRGSLPPGRYVLLPTTFLPGASGRFLLRVFSHAHLHLR